MKIAIAVKAKVKSILINRQHKKYAAILGVEQKGYDSWIREKESRLELKEIGNPTMTYMSYSDCGREFGNNIRRLSEDIIVLRADDGEVSPLAAPLIEEFMAARPAVVLVYGDEDYLTDKKLRHNPWFKPDWSPDTFLDGFYFGSIFAVRREAAVGALEEMAENGALSSVPEENLYELCYRLALRSGGFEKRFAGSPDSLPVGHIPEVLFHAEKIPRLCKSKFIGDYGDFRSELITVVIPSKDHPDILERCLLSFIAKSKNNRYHFIVVDNGSNQENRNKTETLLKKLNEEESFAYPAVYLYHNMPFNFSRMCNMGAAASPEKSGLLLFLNDDIEIIQADWLERLAGKAVLSRVGAVGAKLLYPGSELIQHAGITNIRIGPIHKLQYQSDQEEYYYGKNRGVHNVLAVTGACLMVRRSVFDEVGGFPEELAVAFNDVDLCYAIWEAGYSNVVLNDVILYHHESLSRGNDGEDEVKRIRLEQEKDILYRRHRGLYAKDPYYHKYLIADVPSVHYLPALHNEADLGLSWSKATRDGGEVPACPVDACLRVGVEYATDLFKWRYGVAAEAIGSEKYGSEIHEGQALTIAPADKGYYFHGYAFVIGGDNACYERTLLLKSHDRDGTKGEIWKIAAKPKYRPDIKKALPDQLNVDLTGFAVKITGDTIPSGAYRIGMMVKDRCSRQRIVSWSEKHIIMQKH